MLKNSKKKKAEIYSNAFENLHRVNDHLAELLITLPSYIKLIFKTEKDKLLEENGFFKAINVSINNNTSTVFSVPTISKKIIPEPIIKPNKEFSTEPTMAVEMYDHILKVIYELGKSMEMKPSTYYNKDEEGLRDQILLVS
jgi:hypothetical protein